jgi:hypothetical protein
MGGNARVVRPRDDGAAAVERGGKGEREGLAGEAVAKKVGLDSPGNDRMRYHEQNWNKVVDSVLPVTR